MIRFVILLYLIIIMLSLTTRQKEHALCPPKRSNYNEMELPGVYERVLKWCNSRSNRASDRR